MRYATRRVCFFVGAIPNAGPCERVRTRPGLCGVALTRHDDAADWNPVDHTLDPFGRRALHRSRVVLRPHRDNDLVGREGGECVADGQLDVRLACPRLDRLAGKRLSGPLGLLLRVRERSLVVGQPVEHPLANRGNDNLQSLDVGEPPAKHLVGALDRADHENVAGHELRVPGSAAV
jgi:hypothetical protein